MKPFKLSFPVLEAAFRAGCLWLVALSACGTPDNAPPSFDESSCPFKLDPSQVKTGSGQTVRCGVLDLPEDRKNQGNRRVKVPVLVLKAPAATPALPPLVNLAGGPGQSWGDLGLSQITAKDNANLKRDQIFVEQRGTGLSTPNLSCPELSATSMDQMGANSDPLAACRDRLMGTGINLTAYNTRELAADVEDMRAQLGYAQVFLNGVSYGTSWGLAIVRDFPGGLRGALLDSVLPPQHPLFQGTASGRDSALTALFAACSADAMCNGTFPDLSNKFLNTIAALAKKSLGWKVAPNGQLAADVYVSTVDQVQEAEPGFLPFFIETVSDALTAGKTTLDPADPRIEALLMDTMSATASLAVGQYFSIECADNQGVTAADVMADVAQVRPALRPYLSDAALGLLQVCQEWPFLHEDPSAFAPVQSAVPTLLFSGGLDPTTPPAWAADTVTGLSHGTLMRFPGLAHDVQDSAVNAGETCVSTAMKEFFASGTVPDSACAATVGPTWVLK